MCLAARVVAQRRPTARSCCHHPSCNIAAVGLDHNTSANHIGRRLDSDRRPNFELRLYWLGRRSTDEQRVTCGPS